MQLFLSTHFKLGTLMNTWVKSKSVLSIMWQSVYSKFNW